MAPATRFCAALTDPTLRDIGFYRQANQLWVLAAAPFAAPKRRDALAGDRGSQAAGGG